MDELKLYTFYVRMEADGYLENSTLERALATNEKDARDVIVDAYESNAVFEIFKLVQVDSVTDRALYLK